MNRSHGLPGTQHRRPNIKLVHSSNPAFTLDRPGPAATPNFKEQEPEDWIHSSYPDEDDREIKKADFAVIKYNSDRKLTDKLPPAFSHIHDLVSNHLASASMDDPWGFVNDDVIVLKLNDNPYRRTGRLLLFRINFVANILRSLFPQAKFTPAELRTLLQILAGFSLEQAAAFDCVSKETKKSQLRLVFGKTGIRKQQLLSSFLISHLLLASLT